MITELTSNESNLEASSMTVIALPPRILLRVIQLLSEIAADSPSSSTAKAQQQLEELQKTWNLEDTHVPKLRASIERLKSSCRLLEQDADCHGAQMQAVQHELYDNSIRTQKLEKAVQKLHKMNERLRKKSEQNKKSLAKQLKNFVQKQNEDEQRHQLFAHERILKLEGSNRSRCSSRDTDFSDADMVALQSPITEEELSITSSASSVSTAPSFVTDEGVATVRYSPALGEDEQMLTKKRPHEYHLTFPQGAKIGIQFHKVQLEKAQRGILDDAIQNSSPTECALTPSKDSSSFPVNFKLDALRGKHHDHAYLVCGHYGFDRDLNTQPMLGAQLVKVNGESVEHMTLDKIKAAIKCTKCEFFTLTFRNEMLSEKQKEILNNAVAVTCHQYDRSERQIIASSNVEASAERKGKQPVIICMHEGGNSRLSSLMNSARATRTYGGEESSPGVVAASPSRRNFYSILHGDDSAKTDLVAVDDSSAAADSMQPRSSVEDGSGKEALCGSSRFSSILDSVRSSALPENLGSERLGCQDLVTLSSGRRGLQSILHGDGSSKSDLEDRDTLDLLDGGQHAALSEDISHAEFKGNRLSSLSNNVRNRTYSDSAVIGNFSTSNTEAISTQEPEALLIATDNRLPSLKKGAQSERESPLRHKANVKGTSPLPNDTSSSQKLKKGMKSVGSKFKSLF